MLRFYTPRCAASDAAETHQVSGVAQRVERQHGVLERRDTVARERA
jgi:hypothetical protein